MRNRQLDGIRGLAALSVVLGHCVTITIGPDYLQYTVSDLPGLDTTNLVSRLLLVIFPADAAVLLFFVLSGFVLTLSLQREESAGIAFLPYLVRRAFRLLPAAIVVAIPYFLVRTDGADIGLLFKTMFFLDYSLNGPLWTIQAEVVGSLLVFLLWAGSRRADVFLWLALPISLVVAAKSGANIVPLFLPAFVGGALVFRYRDASIWRLRWLLAGSIVVFAVAGIVVGESTQAARIVIALGACGIVAGVAAQVQPLLETRVVQFLGSVSYPLYLLHMIMIVVVRDWLEPLQPSSDLHPLTQMALTAAVVLALALPASWVVHRFVEVPGMRLGAAAAATIRRVALNAATRTRDATAALWTLTPRERLEGIQLLRLLAAFLVVVQHAWYFASLRPDGSPDPILLRFDLGTNAVSAFFVISGFVMAGLIDERPARFALHRIARLYPPLLVAQLMGGVVAIAVGLIAADQLVFSPAMLLLPMGELQSWTLVPYWTLLYEIVFYAVTFLLMFGGRMVFNVGLIVWASGILLVRALDPTFSIATANLWEIITSPLCFLFISGAALARFRRGEPEPLVIVAVAICGLTVVEPIPLIRGYATFIAVFIPLLGVAILASGRVATSRLGATLARLGDYSYGLYLVHFAAVYLASVSLSVGPVTGTLVALVVGLAWGLIFGRVEYAFYRRVSKPWADRLAERLGRPRIAAQPAE